MRVFTTQGAINKAVDEAMAKLDEAEDKWNDRSWGHEDPHIHAGKAMSDLVRALGYPQVADRYENLDIPWYYA